jgi:predicted  nucleic acid-binding Zn ribbon protein
MAGGHIERESRVTQTGVTELQRDQLILDLKRRGWPLQKIANHPQVRMTKPGVHYALKRLTGQKRVQIKLDTCQSCWGDFPKNQLNSDGWCSECVAGE